MIINNPDALKSWLIVILEPLCDADSSALARYVLALLKKDKPVKELKKVMNEQLHVFLTEETKPFVERLFTAIASEEYLAPIEGQVKTEPIEGAVSLEEINELELLAEPSSIALTTPVEGRVAVAGPDRECTPPLDETKTKEFLNKIDELSTPSSVLTVASATAIVSPATTTKSVSPFKATSDKENQPRESRRRRTSLRSRSRSRSRSNDRSARRSRSRDRRQNEREKPRQMRNKSPPAPNDRRRMDRHRRGGGGGPGGHGSDTRERSPRTGFGGGKIRGQKSRSGSRSRSPSPDRRKGSPPPSAYDSNGKRQRCRDFDEKGYCVRGETCPWDHGVNPLVLDSMPAQLREYNPDAPDLWNRGAPGNNNPFNGPRGGFQHGGKLGNGVPGGYPRPGGAGFRPTAPIFNFPVNPAATPLQRELIPVPTVDANNAAGGDVSAMHAKRRFELEDSVAIAEGPSKRKIPMNSRLGPRIGNIQNNCSLELRKIPRGMNTIAHLNNHFAKFGKIVNIQISYDGDPEAAIVTFSTHAEANVAYRSTEAVLNNRFIKVFWHSAPDANNPNTQIGKDDSNAINGRNPNQYRVNNIPAVPTPAADAAKTTSQTTPDSTSHNGSPTTTVPAAHLPQTSLRTKNNVPRPQGAVAPPNGATNAIIRKKQEEQAKAVAQLAHGLHKRKHELLQGYLKQMKQAVELVERLEPTDPQRSKTLETIKVLQETIDKLRKEIATEQAQITAQMQNQPPAKKSKEQQKKELLDIELELIAQQQEGNDTTAIQKRLEELQRSLGITSGGGVGVGGGKPHFAGSNRVVRMRQTLPVSTSVDRRPKTLVITGFASEDCDAVLGHFKHFGEITKHDVDKAIPQLILSYATRGNAEQAVIRGKVFNDKSLQIAWAPSVQLATQPKTTSEIQKSPQWMPEKSPVVADKTANEVDMGDGLPELRLEDEEEEDESEDRSWRR